MEKRIVISGGPSSGKTSIINALLKKGYLCQEEFSREIIDEGIRTGSGIVPWDKLDLFTEKIFEGRIAQFNNYKTKKPVFYDRSIIDSIAYMEYDNEPIPTKYNDYAKKLRYYPKIFITPYWDEIYTTDDLRKEPSETARLLEKSIIKCYKDYGYEVILVPKTTIDERIEFILNKIHE